MENLFVRLGSDVICQIWYCAGTGSEYKTHLNLETYMIPDMIIRQLFHYDILFELKVRFE